MAAPGLPSMDHLERYAVLFGYPIAHSMSPLLHQTIYDSLGLNWSQYLYESKDIPAFLKMTQDPRFYGASVTMPHKLAIMQHLDELTDEARLVGACNTIFFRDSPSGTTSTTGSKRLLVGTNTDVIGIRESFYQNISDPDTLIHNRPGMVVGGGGAARAALYALKKFFNCKTVYLVNRDKSEVDAALAWCNEHGYGEGMIHIATAEQAESLDGPGAIVACVPDIPPNTPAERDARAVIETMLAKPHKGAILEMAYHPAPWTTLCGLSEKAGWKVILGTEAMIYQGFEQDRYWTGKELSDMPVEKVKAVIAEKLSKARH